MKALQALLYYVRGDAPEVHEASRTQKDLIGAALGHYSDPPYRLCYCLKGGALEFFDGETGKVEWWISQRDDEILVHAPAPTSDYPGYYEYVMKAPAPTPTAVADMEVDAILLALLDVQEREWKND